MNNKFFLISLSLLLLSACVATVGPSISVPTIPPINNLQNPPLYGSRVAVGSIKDTRSPDYNSAGQGLVTPEGDVSRVIENSFQDYLKSYGAETDLGAPIIIKGEIREWQSAYQGSTSGSLDSEAAIYIEVLKQAGNSRIYSGVFKGNRSSHFPIVTPADIKDSLGFAMGQAIEQAIKDPNFQRALSNR